MKKHKDIIFGGLFAAIVITLIALGSSRPGPSVKNRGVSPVSSEVSSRITLTERSFDFGSVRMGAGKVAHSFAMQNRGTKPIMIRSIYTSCMCTEASFRLDGAVSGPFGMPGHGPMPAVNRTIAPGQDAIIETVFDPAAHGPAGIGRIERSVYVETDSGEPLELNIAARVTF